MKKHHRILLFSLLGLLALLVVLLQVKVVDSSSFPSYSSYYGIRQSDSIQENGFPIVFDSLSYQGRVNVSQVAFYYICALFTLFIPTILFFKYASILLWVLIVIFIYLVSNRLFSNKLIVWLLTFFAILSPTLFTAHLNSLDPVIFFALLFLLLLNSFFKLNETSSIVFVVLIILSTFISSLSLVLALSFLIYAILVKISSKKFSRFESELLLFSSVFIIWLHFILYRQLFLAKGISLFQASIPTELLISSFSDLSIPVAISIAGLVPLILGLYAVYYILFKENNKKHLFLVSFLFGFLTALWLGFIPFMDGFFFITILLIILSGITLKSFNGYLNKTVLEKFKLIFVFALLILVSLNFIPLLNYDSVIISQSPTLDEINTMHYISENTTLDSTVLATIGEGYLISSEGNRKNFFDENFIFAPQANQRYLDAKSIFLSKSQRTILSQLNYYDIDYVYVSKQKNKIYPSTSNTFESDCFKKIFETNTTKLYEQTCNK